MYIGCHNDEEDSVYQDVIYGILIIQSEMPTISLKIKEHVEIHEKRLLLLSKYYIMMLKSVSKFKY